jgi:hypothetical protein
MTRFSISIVMAVVALVAANCDARRAALPEQTNQHHRSVATAIPVRASAHFE